MPAQERDAGIQLGPRPYFLVNDMHEGPLKDKLLSCAKGPFRRSDFSIGHRGAALQFPEHTRESYEAAARMGAGIVECDVTFTKDLELVCRHGQNDLHTTTNILVTPLASRCTTPFTPATFGPDGRLATPARAECRTSDLTLAEFKTLRGKMDAFNPAARTPEEFQGGTEGFRTDLYAGPTSGHLLTHRESIELFKTLGVKMTPELKAPVVPMPFNGLTQEGFAQKLVDDYKAAGVPASRVFPQSFSKADVLYWVKAEPDFGRQAVYLDDAQTPADLPNAAELKALKAGRHQHLGAADVCAAGARRRQSHRGIRRRPATRRRPAWISSPGRWSGPGCWPTAGTVSTTRRSIEPFRETAT